MLGHRCCAPCASVRMERCPFVAAAQLHRVRGASPASCKALNGRRERSAESDRDVGAKQRISRIADHRESQCGADSAALSPRKISMTPSIGRFCLLLASAMLACSCQTADDATIDAREPASVANEAVNSIGMKFVRVPKGTFAMGSQRGNRNADLDERQHEVTLSRDYFIGAFECTQEQYERVMGKNPSQFQDPRSKGSTANHPVERVSWNDAVEFCRRLSSLPEEEQEGRVYRLPTESEWEYACRAGTTTSYSYGDEEGQLGDYAWFANNSGNVVLDAKKLLLASKDKRSNDDRLERYQCRTHPVGRKRPNSWGLFDMHGNVWEWCSDWYGDYPMVAVTDPQGPVQGSVRIRRGGPWNDPAECCRSAYRDFREPTHTSHSLGFRLALSPSGAGREPPEAVTEK